MYYVHTDNTKSQNPTVFRSKQSISMSNHATTTRTSLYIKHSRRIGVTLIEYYKVQIVDIFDMLTNTLTSHTMVKLDPSYDCSSTVINQSFHGRVALESFRFRFRSDTSLLLGYFRFFRNTIHFLGELPDRKQPMARVILF